MNISLTFSYIFVVFSFPTFRLPTVITGKSETEKKYIDVDNFSGC